MKFADKLVERNAILKAQRNGDGKSIHQAAIGRAFFVDIDKDLAQSPILVFARAQVNPLTRNAGLDRVAEPPFGELLAYRPVRQLGGRRPALRIPGEGAGTPVSRAPAHGRENRLRHGRAQWLA